MASWDSPGSLLGSLGRSWVGLGGSRGALGAAWVGQYRLYVRWLGHKEVSQNRFCGANGTNMFVGWGKGKAEQSANIANVLAG